MGSPRPCASTSPRCSYTNTRSSDGRTTGEGPAARERQADTNPILEAVISMSHQWQSFRSANRHVSIVGSGRAYSLRSVRQAEGARRARIARSPSEADAEVPAAPRRVDVWFEPDPAKDFIGRPDRGIAGLWLRPLGDWPTGIYEGPPLLWTRLVVVSELPVVRSTLRLRLLGGLRTADDRASRGLRQCRSHLRFACSTRSEATCRDRCAARPHQPRD